MGTLPIFLVLVLAQWGYANDPIYKREYVWNNFQEFVDYGWREQYNGTTRVYDTPSGLDPKLYNLNKNFNEEVWGWSQRGSGRTSNQYKIDIRTKPEYCGMINASITIRYYIEGMSGAQNNHLYPACTSSSSYSYQCRIASSTFATWSTMSQNIMTGYANNLYLQAYLTTAGMFLIDQVRLTYFVQQGISCPYSCDHECEYRGIDCHNYYTCIDRMYKEFYTCNKEDGLAFNPETKSCDLIENVHGCNVTKPPPPPHCICEYRPHEDCSQYWYCPDTCHPEECEVRQCPSGLLWSVDAKGDGSGHQQCVSPEKATCFNETISTTTEWWNPPTSTEPTTETTGEPTQESSTTSPQPSSTSPEPSPETSPTPSPKSSTETTPPPTPETSPTPSPESSTETSPPPTPETSSETSPTPSPESSTESSPTRSPESSTETSPTPSPEPSTETTPPTTPETSPTPSPESSMETTPPTTPETTPDTSAETSPETTRDRTLAPPTTENFTGYTDPTSTGEPSMGQALNDTIYKIKNYFLAHTE